MFFGKRPLVPQEPSDLRRSTLALMRKELWVQATFCESSQQTNTVKVPRAFVERLTDAVCYAAWWLKSKLLGGKRKTLQKQLFAAFLPAYYHSCVDGSTRP